MENLQVGSPTEDKTKNRSMPVSLVDFTTFAAINEHHAMPREIDALGAYCERWSTAQSTLLHELERETHLKTLAPQMMSGHLQGRLLSLLSQLCQPRVILEVGTFTAYATLCLAEGLPPGGRLHTIEVNEELAYLIRKYIRRAGGEDRIQLHLGDAAELIPQIEGDFDLVFIDAGKMDYARHYDLVIDRLRPGGLLLADNVLWSGKIVDRLHDDPDAQILHAFNQKVQADERVDNLILPIRDGLSIARKR